MLYIKACRNNLIQSLWNEPLSYFLPDGVRGISFSANLGFNITPALMSMPVKKKRKIDPQILKAREEKKKKKIEREIRNIEKMRKILKPIEEARIPTAVIYEMDTRRRLIDVPQNVKEERILLSKVWSRYKTKQSRKDQANINRIVKSQQKALDELHIESVDLYNAAIQIIPDLIPFTYNGPSDSPPIADYSRPDGEYIDISKNWLDKWKPKD